MCRGRNKQELIDVRERQLIGRMAMTHAFVTKILSLAAAVTLVTIWSWLPCQKMRAESSAVAAHGHSCGNSVRLCGPGLSEVNILEIMAGRRFAAGLNNS